MSIEYEYKFFDRSAGKYGQGENRTWTVTRVTVDPVVLIHDEYGHLVFSWTPNETEEANAIATIIKNELLVESGIREGEKLWQGA